MATRSEVVAAIEKYRELGDAAAVNKLTTALNQFDTAQSQTRYRAQDRLGSFLDSQRPPDDTGVVGNLFKGIRTKSP